MGSWKWNQTESKCFHAVRDGTSQLRWNAIRHGGNENRPVHHRQTFPFLSRQGDTRKFWIDFNIKLLRAAAAAVMSFNIIQEEMQFEDGFLGVVQPIHATVGIETR